MNGTLISGYINYKAFVIIWATVVSCYYNVW